MSPERVSLRRLPLRARLTLWYVLVLGVALGFFSLYLFFRLHRAVLEQVDAGLRAAAVQAFSIVDDEGPTVRFVRGEEPEATRHNLGQAGFAVRLLALDGTVLEGFGSYRDVPLARPVTDYQTLEENDAEWRLYTQTVAAHGGATAGYLQVAQSLTLADAASEGLLVQIVAGLPLVLALAAAGGWFLAVRALRPIDRITRTAQAISANDLAQRIQYTGPDDDVGRLARTFDQMLDRLQAAFERERRFTADASHELRTPLTAIKGQMDVALSRPRSTAEYETAMRQLQPQVERLIRLTSDLLFITRLGLSPWRSPSTRVHLSDMLEAIIEQAQPLAEQHGLTLAAAISPGLSTMGDPDQLIRLFMNLLDNAIKYTPPGGQVTVRAAQTPTEARISVADTGPGIPAEHLPHLFERFYRVEADRSRQAGGAGLGLAIASEIVRVHRGTLDVQSRPGVGTTVTVCLPRG